MRKTVLTILLAGAAVGAAQAETLSIRNVSEHYTIGEVYLTPASLQEWGPNRLEGYPAIQPGATLILPETAAGRYDMRLADISGQTCTLQNVEVGAMPTMNFDGEACVVASADRAPPDVGVPYPN
jgi:hypothetical protein